MAWNAMFVRGGWGEVGLCDGSVCGLLGGGAWLIFFFQAEDGIRDIGVTGVQTCALPISLIIQYSLARIVAVKPEITGLPVRIGWLRDQIAVSIEAMLCGGDAAILIVVGFPAGGPHAVVVNLVVPTHPACSGPVSGDVPSNL